MEQDYQEQNQHLSVGDWVITLILTAIPLVGIIMLFIWAFSSETHPSKSNWAKAALIIAAIAILLYIIVIFIFGAAFLSVMKQ